MKPYMEKLLQAEAKDTIPAFLWETVKKFPERPALKFKGQSNAETKWQLLSWQEAFVKICALAAGLAETGLKPGDKIGLLADNRHEWLLLDFAIQINGAISVPRGTDSTKQEMEYILKHSDSVMLIAENEKVIQKLESSLPKLSAIKKIILIDDSARTKPNQLSYADLLRLGEENGEKWAEEILARLQAIQSKDVYTIIYTSGTTGVPKGVQQTHGNEVHQMKYLPSQLNLHIGQERLLSILPVWHTFERMVEYIIVASANMNIYTSIRDLKQDIQEQKPTFMASAPRLWEQIYNGINANIQAAPGIKKVLFNLAYGLSSYFGKGRRFLQGNELRLSPASPLLSMLRGIIYIITLPLVYPFYKFFDFLVLKKIRAATGGELRGSISGGGALPRHVDEFFNNIGIAVLEGYGMTESAPVIAARTFDKLVIGSVGSLLKEVDVQIRDENGRELPRGSKGIVWTRGPHVMKGYYKMEDITRETIQEGWLNTGDMGLINFNDTLTLTGRAKDTIVLLGGENVEPVPIENALSTSEFIDHIMVVGQNQKTLGALIYPNMDLLQKWKPEISLEEVTKNQEVWDLFNNEIKKYISAHTGFKSFERVSKFRFLPKPFEKDDELTAKLSLKRHVISEKYEDLIREMYQG